MVLDFREGKSTMIFKTVIAKFFNGYSEIKKSSLYFLKNKFKIIKNIRDQNGIEF